jgi:hypothetical protein
MSPMMTGLRPDTTLSHIPTKDRQSLALNPVPLRAAPAFEISHIASHPPLKSGLNASPQALGGVGSCQPARTWTVVGRAPLREYYKLRSPPFGKRPKPQAGAQACRGYLDSSWTGVTSM